MCELLLAFLKHAKGHYVRADGTQTHEVAEYKLVSRYLRELYSRIPAKEFGPLALKTMRQRFIEAGWCRSLVNQRVNRIRRIFKWGAGEELIPFEVYQKLTTVAGLQKGRSEVREAEPVQPVRDEAVDAILPHVSRPVRGLIEFQRLTGCRPGEACMIRRVDIDTAGKVWLYRPPQHKCGWRGKPRIIAIGPKAQDLLKMFFTSNLDDFLFSPRRAVEEQLIEPAKNRVTPRYPSHMRRNAERRVKTPRRKPDEFYDPTSYGKAVARGCDFAFPPPGTLRKQEGETKAEWKDRLSAAQREELVKWQREHRWHPNRLRHSFATRTRRDYGLEAAQVLLGHSKADVTQVYAERNLDLAVSVAAQIG